MWVVGSSKEVILGDDPWIGCDQKFFLSEDLRFHLNSKGYFYLKDIVGEGHDRFGTQIWLLAQDLELDGDVAIEWNLYISQLKRVGIVLMEEVKDHLV